MKPKPPRGTAPPPPIRQTPAPPAEPFVRRHGLILAALWALVLLANLNSFRDGFAYDNNAVILQDARLRAATPENIHLILTQDYWPNHPGGLYRPLVQLSFLFNYTILGNATGPAGYHAVNLALHTANVALVYALGLLLFRRRFWAAAMAALWAVHPVLTESVTNLVGRSDLFAGFGILGGLICYVRSLTAQGARRVLWLAGAALATAIGMFSKENAVVVLAALALYDLAFPKTADRWQRRLPGYLCVAGACLFYFAVRVTVMGQLPPILIPFTDNPIASADFWTGRLTAIHVLGKYIGLLLWPAHLSCDYAYNQVPLFNWHFATAGDWPAVGSLALYLALAALGVACYRRNRIVFFCIGLFLCALAPTSNVFVLVGANMAERFLYIPAVAFVGLAVAGLRILSQRLHPAHSQRAVAGVAAIVCLAFAARTYARNFDWLDDETLFRAAAIDSPNSYRTHSTLALNLAFRTQPKDLDFAVASAARSIEILRGLPDSKNAAGPYAVAGGTYRLKAMAVSDPAGRRVWLERAVETLTKAGRIDRLNSDAAVKSAATHGVRILRGGWVPLYADLGRAYLALGQPANAIEALRAGRSIRPDAEFFDGIALGYHSLGDRDREALSMFEAVGMRIQPQHFVRELVDLYRQSWPNSCAVGQSGGNFSLNPDCPLVHDHLCRASANIIAIYNDTGQPQKATDTATSAIHTLGCPASLFH